MTRKKGATKRAKSAPVLEDSAPNGLAAEPSAEPLADATLVGATLVGATPAELLRGTVIRAAGGQYEVDVRFEEGRPSAEGRLSDEGIPSDDETLVCSLRGTLKRGRRETAQPVSVGDTVMVRALEKTGVDARGRRLREGHILEALPRRSALARARANKTMQVTVANLDQVAIVMSMREPELNTHRLDRFLVLAEASDLGVVICLNKIDLLKKRERKQEINPIEKLYRALGYQVVAISAETDENINALRALLKNKITAVLGSSGVGKSSLANAVQPGLRLWVGDVMEIGKGRHTTTDVSLHPLSFGGYLADTPGIKTVSLFERDELNLALCFPEFESLSAACRFNNCLHDTEPGCAVRQAADEGGVAASRYDSYLKMLHEARPRGDASRSGNVPAGEQPSA